MKRLLFIGVGCQVQSLRAVEPYLGLEQLYVLGTNCTDNGPREGLDKFLRTASADPDTVLHYEFMQDYKVGGVGRWGPWVGGHGERGCIWDGVLRTALTASSDPRFTSSTWTGRSRRCPTSACPQTT